MPQQGFPPWLGVFPGERGSTTPALAGSEGTSPVWGQSPMGTELSPSKHTTIPARNAAPVLLQEPCSPLQ